MDDQRDIEEAIEAQKKKIEAEKRRELEEEERRETRRAREKREEELAKDKKRLQRRELDEWLASRLEVLTPTGYRFEWKNKVTRLYRDGGDEWKENYNSLHSTALIVGPPPAASVDTGRRHGSIGR